METITDRAKAIKALGEKITGIKVAMLTTVKADGSLHSRPMYTQDIEFDGDLWFFLSADSSPATEVEIQKQPQVSLTYAKPGDDLYVAIAGTAEVTRDHARMEYLWRPSFGTWFPQGLDDPKLSLLKVTVHSAEYWKGSGNQVIGMMRMAIASVTNKPAPPPGEDTRIELN